MAKKIYLAAFPLNSGSGRVRGSSPGGDVMGNALAEDGTGIASHLSSNVGYAKHDMGLTSDWKHELYAEHYPDGYELEWVDEPETHAGWRAAMVLNRQRHEASQADDAVDPQVEVLESWPRA